MWNNNNNKNKNNGKKPFNLMLATIIVGIITILMFWGLAMVVGVVYQIGWISLAMGLCLVPLAVIVYHLIKAYIEMNRVVKIQKFAVEEFTRWRATHPDIDMTYFEEHILPNLIREKYREEK